MMPGLILESNSMREILQKKGKIMLKKGKILENLAKNVQILKKGRYIMYDLLLHTEQALE